MSELDAIRKKKLEELQRLIAQFKYSADRGPFKEIKNTKKARLS